MSCDQLSTGYLIRLKTPIQKEDRERFMEDFWEYGKTLRITYSGECAYVATHDDDVYSTYLNDLPADPDLLVKMYEELADLGWETVGEPIPFHCVWYDGADCPIDELTLEEVNAQAPMKIRLATGELERQLQDLVKYHGRSVRHKESGVIYRIWDSSWSTDLQEPVFDYRPLNGGVSFTRRSSVFLDESKFVFLD